MNEKFFLWYLDWLWPGRTFAQYIKIFTVSFCLANSLSYTIMLFSWRFSLFTSTSFCLFKLFILMQWEKPHFDKSFVFRAISNSGKPQKSIYLDKKEEKEIWTKIDTCPILQHFWINLCLNCDRRPGFCIYLKIQYQYDVAEIGWAQYNDFRFEFD